MSRAPRDAEAAATPGASPDAPGPGTGEGNLGLPPVLTDRVAEALLDDAEPRACDALPGEACTVVPGNAAWNVVSGAFSKLGEQLSSPGTVLPWILATVGAPSAFTALLVPVKDAGSLLPQLAVAGTLRAKARRAPWWVGAAAVQTIALALMALAVALADGTAAGMAIIAALAAFSVASGVASVAFKDVMAKTVPEGGRGRVLAWRSTVGGLLGVAAGLGLTLVVDGADARAPYVLLIAGAAGCFAGATLSFARIREEPGHRKGGRNALDEARVGLRLLRSVPGFRAFVTARALLLAVPLALPFLTVFGREHVDASLGGLGVFVAANALAASLASPAWGRAADLAAHRTMALGGAISVLAVGYAFTLAWGPVPEEWRSAWTYVPAFLLAGVGYAGVRLGRKTYLVDAPPNDDRPTWVAVANTSIGGATLIGAAVGATAAWWGASGALVVFSVLTLVGCAAAWRLPEASELRARAERGAA